MGKLKFPYSLAINNKTEHRNLNSMLLYKSGKIIKTLFVFVMTLMKFESFCRVQPKPHSLSLTYTQWIHSNVKLVSNCSCFMDLIIFIV